MRYFIFCLEFGAVLLAILSAAFAQGHGSSPARKCGEVVAGIELCLSRSADLGGATLEIRNAVSTDALLNLGVMLWVRQYPTAITLVLKDTKGKEHHAELAEPGGVIGGRILPFVVPLPSGASLKLPVRISKCLWYASGRLEDFEPDPQKHYSLRAQFTGKGVSQTDPDFKGLTLMPYWTGTAVSNTVSIGPS